MHLSAPRSPPRRPRKNDDVPEPAASAPNEWARDSVSLSALGRAVSRKPRGVTGKKKSGGAEKTGISRVALADTLETLEAHFPPASALRAALPAALLNTPLVLWGVGAPADLVGLASYASAASAGAPNSVTTAARDFALLGCRVPAPALSGEPPLTAPQFAAIAAARALGAGDCVAPADRERLFACMPVEQVEWLVFAAALSPVLATAVEAADVLLAGSITCGECGITHASHDAALPAVRARSGARSLPRAATLSTSSTPSGKRGGSANSGPFSGGRLGGDMRAFGTTPGTWPRVGRYLSRRLGHEFPIMRSLRHARPMRALAATLVRVAEGAGCEISLRMKCLAAMVYAGVHNNKRMSDEWRGMASARGLRSPVFDAVDAFVQESALRCCDLSRTRSCLEDALINPQQQAVLLVAKEFARGGAPSPVVMCAATRHLDRRHVGEIASFIAVLSAYHRLYLFYLPEYHETSH